MPYNFSAPQLGILTTDQDPFPVKVPFDMKDAFKAQFPAARWNPNLKAWNLPKSTMQSVEAWIEEEQQTFQTLLEAHELAKSEFEAAEEERREAEARARLVRETEQRRRATKLAEGEVEFARHASVSDARKAFSLVCGGAGIPKAWARQDRDEGLAALKTMQGVLRAAGIQSKGIQDLRVFNMNRISKAEARAAEANLFLMEAYVEEPSDDE